MISFIEAAAVSLTAGFCLVYVMPWISSCVSSSITLTDQRLGLARGGAAWRDYSIFTGFEWGENSEFATLIFHLPANRMPIIVGVPPEISRDEVSAFLITRGLPSLSDGHELRVPKSRALSFRAEMLQCSIIAVIVGVAVVWFSTKARFVFEMIHGPDASYPLLTRFALSAHISGPVILLVTLLLVARMKLRRPQTVWPSLITIGVGLALLFTVVIGIKVPFEQAIAKRGAEDAAKGKHAP